MPADMASTDCESQQYDSVLRVLLKDVIAAW